MVVTGTCEEWGVAPWAYTEEEQKEAEEKVTETPSESETEAQHRQTCADGEVSALEQHGPTKETESEAETAARVTDAGAAAVVAMETAPDANTAAANTASSEPASTEGKGEEGEAIQHCTVAHGSPVGEERMCRVDYVRGEFRCGGVFS